MEVELFGIYWPLLFAYIRPLLAFISKQRVFMGEFEKPLKEFEMPLKFYQSCLLKALKIRVVMKGMI